MKILHVINSLGGSGGAEHGLVREITRFSDETEQRVVRLFEKDHLDGELSSAGVDVIPLGLAGSRAGWNWPLAVGRLTKVIEAYRPDVIHSSLFTANLVAQFAGRRSGIPVLSTFTLSGDSRLLKQYQPGAHSWRGWVLRRVASLAARYPSVHFRALTQDALETNCELLAVDSSRATVIPRGIESDLFPSSPKTREQLGLPIDGRLLVNVGRQTAQKGHLSLLEAFEIVRSDVDAHLAIIGREGETSGLLRSTIANKGFDKHVTLVGYTPDVHHYMANADTFVFTSFMEGLGTAVLEAMVMGVPVVAYDIPPVREITNEGRFARLIDAGDYKSFAEAVLDVLAGDIGENPREWVRQKFTIDQVAPQVEGLLERVASS